MRLANFAAFLVIVCVRLTAVAGQSIDGAPGVMPHLHDGGPNLFAPTVRTPDGKTDLSGVWEPDGPRYLKNLAADLKAEEIPLQPWAETLLRERQRVQRTNEFEAKCMPPGVPKIDATLRPFKIIQTPGVITILYEAFDVFRQIFTDGRALPGNPEPTWMGYSVGKWLGDILVVDSIGFTDKTWLDDAGHPHTESLHVTERLQRRDLGHMDIEIAIDDPKAYTRLWTIVEHLHLVPNSELREYVCNAGRDSK